MEITSKTWKAAAKKWWWQYDVKNAEFYEAKREATHNQIFAVSQREKKIEARRWARKLYADNARLRELIKSVEWGNHKWDMNRCPWCLGVNSVDISGNELSHFTDCPAFNPDGTVK